MNASDLRTALRRQCGCCGITVTGFDSDFVRLGLCGTCRGLAENSLGDAASTKAIEAEKVSIAAQRQRTALARRSTSLEVSELADLIAPRNKFRIIGVDTFSGEDWVVDDLDTLDAAKAQAREMTRDKKMLKMHIYDDKGQHMGEEGSF